MGRGPAPLFVLKVIEGLPDTSYTSALISGGRQFYGWGTDRYMAAELYDAMNLNTAASGNWAKGKAPKFKPFPRPSKDAPGGKRKASVMDLHRSFAKRL